jgi:hypothetical protein
MPEIRYVDGQPAVRNTGVLTEARDIQAVWLWDCGPDEPEMPEPPEPPFGKEGDPKYDLAKLQYKRALKRYEDGLLDYEAKDKEHRHWHTNVRGPIEVLFSSTNARDALVHDGAAVEEKRQQRRRYYLSSRTRGSERLKNYGLPNGVVPGPGHRENLERQIAGEKEFVEILKSDPHFGQETRP